MNETTVDMDQKIWPLHDLRACFYMLHPQETYYKNVDEMPPFFFSAAYPWGLALLILEIVILNLTGKSDEWRLHSAVISYSSTAIFEGFHLFLFRGLELQLYQWTYDNFRVCTLPWNSLTTFLISLVSMEFGAYWWHRMSHELSVMWAAHELHHSSDDFNMSIAFRNSAGIRLFKWIFYVPLAFVGVPTSIMLTHLTLGSIFNSIVHQNYIPKFKTIIPVFGNVIDFIFVTPSHHRVHHASNKYCIDKNYGQYTILFDRLFGTFQEEKDDEHLIYGSLTQPQTYDIASLQVSSFIKQWEKLFSMETVENKLKSVFYGPGWFPGTPRLGNPEDIPDVSGRDKYRPTYPFSISCYLVINCFCVFYSYVNMAHRVNCTENHVLFINLAYIILAYSAIGGLYDRKSYAANLELFRNIVFFLLSSYFLMLSQTNITQIVKCVMALNVLVWPYIVKYNKGDLKQD